MTNLKSNPLIPISKDEFMTKHNGQPYMLCEMAELILKVEADGPDFASLRDAAHDFLEQHEKLHAAMKANGVCLG